jgi:hypothetical protein
VIRDVATLAKDEPVTVHEGPIVVAAGRFLELRGDRVVVDHWDYISAVPLGSDYRFVTDADGLVIGEVK